MEKVGKLKLEKEKEMSEKKKMIMERLNLDVHERLKKTTRTGEIIKKKEGDGQNENRCGREGKDGGEESERRVGGIGED